MPRTKFVVALSTVVAGFALAQSAAAVTQGRTQIETGSNMCTLSVPTIDTKVRPRANGFKNEGTTNAFVICTFDAPPGANFINGTEFSYVYLILNSLDGVARDVTCTGVNSIPSLGQTFVSKTVSVAGINTETMYQWGPEEFGGSATIPYSSGAFSVTCSLPPNVSIVSGRADSLEDVGN